MALDVRTLFVVHALITLTLAGLMLAFWRGRRDVPGLGHWTAGTLLLGAMILGVALRGALPDFLSIVVANSLGVLSLACYRSEEHTSELQSLMRISYAVFCLKKKTHK